MKTKFSDQFYKKPKAVCQTISFQSDSKIKSVPPVIYLYFISVRHIQKHWHFHLKKNIWSFRIDESGKTSKILFKSLYFGGRNHGSKWYLSRPFYIFILYPSDIYHNFADILLSARIKWEIRDTMNLRKTREKSSAFLPFQLVEIIISIVCLKRTSFIIWLCACCLAFTFV